MRNGMPESPYPMVSVEQAQQVIMGRVVPLEAEEVDALTADGRVLAQAIQAPLNIPDVPKAAMDGYALRTDDGLKPRRIVAELTAGMSAGVSLDPGTAVRIMTGAPMPAGADAMLPVELAEEHAGWLTLHHSLQSGQHVHTVGQDAAQGTTILPQGTVIGTPELGLLATFGLTRVQVYRRPRVAVLATGDEVIEPGAPRPVGAVYDSNRYALMAAMREAGCEVFSLGIVPDDHTKQREALLRGLEVADVLVTSGGVSMGSRDLIKPLLAELGTVHFGRIAFKPGKPTTFATVGAKLAFGLPGYPVSSLVSCEVFVRPALRALQGDPHPWRPRVRVRLSTPIRPSHDRPEYQRVTIRQEGLHLVAG
ncbi:MAG: molybdopterin molybdenumtransferase MoeA, partial [Chloroflexia bacterium]|nr:molybdopterin molybdenumtransferase MoeA [Chloroflexia bacterium]